MQNNFRDLRTYALTHLRTYLGRATFQAFPIDVPLLIACGLAVAFLSVKFFKNNKKALFGLFVLTQIAFWTVSALMYFDWNFFASRGWGNDFMWNGYIRNLGIRAMPLDKIPTYHDAGLNALAFFICAVEPALLYLGVRWGWRLWLRDFQ